jgi:hypothetical protein
MYGQKVGNQLVLANQNREETSVIVNVNAHLCVDPGSLTCQIFVVVAESQI